ncbi:MAG TPA: HAD family phosphatase [Acidobacteriaceae bacterium]|jgi:putative hydrolase of the HAD superfamily
MTQEILIRAVLFDFGLVLSGPPDPAAHRRLERILHTTQARLDEVYWRHRHDYDRGVLDGASFWRTVGAELDHPPTEDELTQLFEADSDMWTQPNQPMIDWAGALQRDGIVTGVLSNMGDVMETGIFERCPWINGFAHLIFSHRLLIAKPDERIYSYALGALNVRASELLFIDDRIENIEAARAIGLQAIHYTRHEDFVRAFEDGRFGGLPAPAETSSTR